MFLQGLETGITHINHGSMIIGQPRPQGLLVFQYGGVTARVLTPPVENDKTLGRGQIIK